MAEPGRSIRGIGVVVALAVALSCAAGCAHEISPLVDPGAEDEVAFQRARAAYDAAQFDLAQQGFDDLLAAFPRSRRAAEAWYLAGRCRYERGLWDDAVATLLAMRAAYPQSPSVVSAS